MHCARRNPCSTTHCCQVLIEQRFRAGDAIYRGEWMDHDPDWFVTEALEEAADLVVYLAMRRVIRQT